jgi:hypothetical protein
MDDIHDTARSYFLAKIVNGRIPEMVEGGPYDGLAYFPEVIDGVLYWVAEFGLIAPPAAPPAMLVERDS